MKRKKSSKSNVAPAEQMITKCGLYIRVSTPRQAAVQEGSLKNQKQLLDNFIRAKNEFELRMAQASETGAAKTHWEIVDYYVEQPRTATEFSKRLEYQRLISDVKRGRINTVVCVSLSRISRSVKNFLELIDLLHAHDADFVSLKEDFDSTTPQGRCFMTILLALYQFEAEIDSQRSKDSSRARSERGLWVGGRMLGYDLDPKRPGYPLVNEKEKSLVNLIFDKYLEVGSVAKLVKVINAAGFRTKGYVSRREKVHKAREFTFSTLRNILRNRAYLGEREIGKRFLDHKPKPGQKGEEYRRKKGVWEAIVDPRKFAEVNKLLDVNERTKRSGVEQPRHLFLFNGGILRCDKCDGVMKGASGTSKTNKVYRYYKCGKCSFRVPATEIEEAVKGRLRELCRDQSKLERLIQITNERLRAELPKIEEHRKLLRSELEQINALAAGIMDRYATALMGDAKVFVQERLDDLAKRRSQVMGGLDALEEMAKEIERDMIEKAVVQKALEAFDQVFEKIPPYRKKEYVESLIGQIRFSDARLAIGIDGRPGAGLRAPEKQEPAPVETQEAGSQRHQTGGDGATRKPPI